MPSKLFLLLPPSEGKEVGGAKGREGGIFSKDLTDQRKTVISQVKGVLKNSNPMVLEKTFGVRGPLLERAIESMTQLVEGRAPVLPAYQRYSGVVWSHLEPSTLNADQRKQIVIPSGLYGLTTAEDMIADYRLKMNISLAGIGNVAKFWQPSLTKCLRAHLLGSVVLNLLPKEHGRAINLKSLSEVATVATIEFVGANGTQAAGHDAKAVKGVVARVLLTNGLDGLVGFRWNGWKAKEKSGQWKIVAPKE
jgi:cytoplasmic iron level regulating protein YaaA (DUF328/UPF0246 family)